VGVNQSACLKIEKKKNVFFPPVIPLVCQELPPTQQPTSSVLAMHNPKDKNKMNMQEEYVHLLSYEALILFLIFSITP